MAWIESVAAAKSIGLASFGQRTEPEVTESHAQPQADAAATTEAPTGIEKKPSARVLADSPSSASSTPRATRTLR